MTKRILSRFRVGKVHISLTNPESTRMIIKDHAISGNGGYVCVSNIRMIQYADNHSDYVALMSQSLMNLPDGTPLTWLSKLWGIKGVGCTSGPALFRDMLNEKGIKHYLLGDTDEVIKKIVEKSNREINAQLVGAESLPFVQVDGFDYQGISQRIIDSGAQIVWTAMRSPKQDEFNQRLSRMVPNVVCIGVGRAFRVLIGEFKPVPRVAQKLGLSGFWLRRGTLVQEFGFYFKASFSLIKYAGQIALWRLKGRKYYG